MECNLNPSNFITPLKSLSIIRIEGEQSSDYLHGQLTVDTKNFDENKARLTAHCDFKGKMFSVSFLSKFKNNYFLTAHKDSASESLQQLKKYGVFSKVEIKLCDRMKIFGVYGDDASKDLKTLFPDAVDEHLSSVQNSFGQVISFNDSSKRYLFIATEDGEQQLREVTGDLTNSEQIWEKLEIEAGLSNIQSPTISQYVPQMLNLQYLNAIDFDKGCYMGQEVVARTKFLGKNKRATFIFQGETSTPNTLAKEPSVGDSIEVKIDESWRRGGTILRVVKLENDQSTEFKGLAVMANDTAVGSVLRLKGSQQELSIQPLPYSIEQ